MILKPVLLFLTAIFISFNAFTQVTDSIYNSKTDEKIIENQDNLVFQKVDIQASFPGGAAAWRNYLLKKLDVKVPINNKAPEGAYTVIVRFIVNRDGTISDVTAETKNGYGMEQEAIKVIENGPKWKPGIQNGNEVTSVRRQPITFIVAGE